MIVQPLTRKYLDDDNDNNSSRYNNDNNNDDVNKNNNNNDYDTSDIEEDDVNTRAMATTTNHIVTRNSIWKPAVLVTSNEPHSNSRIDHVIQ